MTGVFYSGRVANIVFENPSQGFYILKMVLDGGKGTEPTTVKGNVPGITMSVGTWFGFEGDWVTHETHGKQISITKAPVVQGWTPDVAGAVLAANGVGDGVVTRLRAHFGSTFVGVLDKYDPDLLCQVMGMTPLAAAHVVTRWKVAKSYYRTLEFLSDAGVPRNRVSQVWSTFGDEAETVLSTNPWALVRIDGITFQQADEVASKLKLDPASPLRIEGAVRFVTKAKKGLGHLYLTSGEVLGEVQSLLGDVTPEGVGQAIASLHRQKQLVVDGKTRAGVKAIYEPWLHMVEIRSAELLLERAKTALLERDTDVLERYVTSLGAKGTNAADLASRSPRDLVGVATAALLDWSTGSNIVLSDKQLVGVVNALTSPVSIITGLPGTGKSTSLRAVVSILKDANVSFLLAAPTGIAAKRITSLTGAPASTIHRAFGAKGWNKGEEREATYVGVTGGGGAAESSDGSGEMWGCSSIPHSADVVVIDESSMVDQHLLYRVLTCTRPTTRVVLIGDDRQLPSVGPGNVLRDVIASGLFPVVSLTEIFRQADTSQIVVAAHAISRGEVPVVAEDATSDFILMPARTEEQVLDIVVQLAAKLLLRKENFQVMSPRHSGTVGVTNLNAQLREVINPKKPGVQEMRIGSETIREDDRVMVVKNNYEMDIFNGDVGKVQKLDRKDKWVTVKVHGPPVQYVNIPFKDAAEHLRLAYCTTVHKMQGQEADIVVIPLVTGFSLQLQRNLLYTAITRARKRVIMVGHHDALVKAVFNNHPDERNTLFLDRLRKFSEGGS